MTSLEQAPIPTKSDIIVIGAGVIGMATAYELARRGAKVTVIDRAPEPGMGCSYGNAGWITPCFAMPLPMPGMLLKSIGWLTDPDSPLYIKPQPSLLLARWLVRFLLSMRQSTAERAVAALTEISKFSLDAYAELDRLYPGTLGFERKGLLLLGQTPGGVRATLTERELVAPHGIPGRVLSGEEALALEPALLPGSVIGGVYFPEEAHAEPLAVVRALARAAESHGARILPRTEVFDFVTDASRGGAERVVALRTTRGELRADQFVLATGSWSHGLARKLRLNVPVLGGKGYALIVPPLEVQPKIPLMVIERKIAVTPRDGSLRLAGTLELVNGDESITPRRVDAILRGSRQFLRLPEQPEIREIWRGLRPCTPTGMPLICRAPGLSNLVVHTGHQMLGLQSAPGSARLAADLVLGVPATFAAGPFRGL